MDSQSPVRKNDFSPKTNGWQNTVCKEEMIWDAQYLHNTFSTEAMWQRPTIFVCLPFLVLSLFLLFSVYSVDVVQIFSFVFVVLQRAFQFRIFVSDTSTMSTTARFLGITYSATINQPIELRTSSSRLRRSNNGRTGHQEVGLYFRAIRLHRADSEKKELSCAEGMRISWLAQLMVKIILNFTIRRFLR